MTFVTHADAKDCQFIDVREPVEFASEKIPGTTLVPLSQLDKLSDALDRTQPLVIVCRTDNRAKQAGERLRKKGFGDVRILKGGIESWKASGKPIERGAQKVWAMDRQVRFAAGLFVLLGVIGAWRVNPSWIFFSAFVGVGLMFSALTNTCGMATMLSRMPWNRVKP